MKITKYKISIIVPIYNAEKYLKECLISLFEQDFESLQYIFIDDCSTDNSAQILFNTINNYTERKDHVKYIKNDKNYGSGYSRRCGIIASDGEYTIQIDADDWIDLNMCKKLYNHACINESDIVVCDYYEFYEKNSSFIYIAQPCSTDSRKVFNDILSGNLHGSLCNKLVKRNLYTNNGVYPPVDISIFEDKMTILSLISCIGYNKISYLPEAFLYYRKYSHSLTSGVLTYKQINDSIIFINKVYDLFFTKISDNYPKDIKILYSCILYHKKIFLLDDEYYPYWRNCHPEVNHIYYVLGIKVFDWKKKLVYILAILFSRRIMQFFHTRYKNL